MATTPAPTSAPVTVRSVAHAVRWAPAPTWEPGRRARFVAYLGGSMIAWTAVGLGIAALLARALPLFG
ncbi:chemotaxis protein CheW [Cellulomonas sp.]|uniref:chemotaxis protein CheW n=1 Tax=Cellulomonas sp. TaxID=40001 RepID=UPI001B1480D1|nr:chemotaxis protein CheW [Cellulomonas sp.]MBO9554438.1 chemotaxis protein CheW [Cellulomonas sp.]